METVQQQNRSPLYLLYTFATLHVQSIHTFRIQVSQWETFTWDKALFRSSKKAKKILWSIYDPLDVVGESESRRR